VWFSYFIIIYSFRKGTEHIGYIPLLEYTSIATLILLYVER
jgi:hypothetical protein